MFFGKGLTFLETSSKKSLTTWPKYSRKVLQQRSLALQIAVLCSPSFKNTWLVLFCPNEEKCIFCFFENAQLIVEKQSKSHHNNRESRRLRERSQHGRIHRIALHPASSLRAFLFYESDFELPYIGSHATSGAGIIRFSEEHQ